MWTSRRLPASPQCVRFPGAPSPLLCSLPLLMAELTVPSSAFPWPQSMTPEMGAFPRVPGRAQVYRMESGASGASSHIMGKTVSLPREDRTGGLYPWFQPPLNPSEALSSQAVAVGSSLEAITVTIVARSAYTYVL